MQDCPCFGEIAMGEKPAMYLKSVSQDLCSEIEGHLFWNKSRHSLVRYMSCGQNRKFRNLYSNRDVSYFRWASSSNQDTI
jgi:hypothetical protein